MEDLNFNMKNTGNILVVDDTRDNLRLLSDMLTGQGYLVRPVSNGDGAISSAQFSPPDLILLDILMPGIDGYEVCRRLKADERTRDVPIIFISALGDTFDKVKAFEMGGIDYVTKPFQEAEVLARVSTHLDLQRARKSIESQKRQLEQQNQELIEAARLREDVEHITRHDLKNPLNAIISYPCLIREIGELTEKQAEFLKEIEVAGYRMLHMINLSLNLFKMERGSYHVQPVSVNIVPVLFTILAELQRFGESKHLDLRMLLHGKAVTHDDTVCVLGEEMLCYSMLANLIKNAVEAAPDGACVTISLENDDGDIALRIHNPGIVPEEIRDRFFEKYVTFGKNNTGTGLGTYSAKLIAETQGGTISMTSSEQTGTMVTVRLPAGQDSSYNPPGPIERCV